MKWVYGGDLEIPLLTREMTLHEVNPISNMFKLYGVAEKLSSDELMDQTMTAMYNNLRFGVHLEFDEIKLAYAVTSPDSEVRGLRWFASMSFVFNLLFAKTSADGEAKYQEQLEKLQESRHEVWAKRKQLCEQPRITRKAVLDAELAEEKPGEKEANEEPEAKSSPRTI